MYLIYLRCCLEVATYWISVDLVIFLLKIFFAVFIAHRSSHLHPAFPSIKISGAKTKLRCTGAGAKKLGLLSIASW